MSDPVDVSTELDDSQAPGLVGLINGYQREAENGRLVHE